MSAGISYHGRRFRPVTTSENGEVSADTVFVYRQAGNVLSSEYGGASIEVGHLLGIVDHDGSLEFSYHQVSRGGELMTGRCRSTPEVLTDGRLRLHEEWQWTSGDLSSGRSVLEEIRL